MYTIAGGTIQPVSEPVDKSDLRKYQSFEPEPNAVMLFRHTET
jgi:hypothetical protein